MPSYLDALMKLYFGSNNKEPQPGNSLIQQEPRPIIVREGDIYTTRTDTKTSETVNGLLRVKEVMGTGKIDQFMLKTTSNSFNIDIFLDNAIFLGKDYTYYFNNSKQLSGISAYLSGGYYYLSIRDLFFQNHFSVSIKTTSSTVFDEIMIRYTIRNERYR